MPPRTRTRATKVLKENIDVVKNNKQKLNGKVSKPPRTALADKTNSLSDDNASIDVPIKTSKKVVKNNAPQKNAQDSARPKRERRLPPRFIENQVLISLSNSKDSPVNQSSDILDQTPTKNIEKTLPDENEQKNNKSSLKPIKSSIQITKNSISPIKSNKQALEPDKPRKPETKEKPSEIGVTDAIRPKRKCRLQSVQKPPTKENSLNVSSPFKTPPKNLDSSLIGNRPKRICRLPSRFEDHSISPNKFIPVQPCHASTPIMQKTSSTILKNTQKDLLENVETNTTNRNDGKGKSVNKTKFKGVQKSRPIKTNAKASTSSSSMNKSSPDSNNNGKNKKTKTAKANAKNRKQTTDQNGATIAPFGKRILENNLSFKILDDRKLASEKNKNLDIYEFTFDPNEEPAPQKKKRKKTVRKKQPQPKKVVLKSNYDNNVSKALENLKSKIKPSQTDTVQNDANLKENNIQSATSAENIQSDKVVAEPNTNEGIPQSNNYSANIAPEIPVNEFAAGSIHASNYASIRVEDIAADFELGDDNNINYSPVTTPNRPQTPKVPEIIVSHVDPVNKDPLNLQEDMSFFDDQPVASSSMNVSVRHPLASPWRTEFGSLPLKWHSNTYVKPNMTPAVESSFINAEETTKKKHVYTNIVPEEPLPEIEENTPNLIQTSILSFIKEVVEKNANKKKRRLSRSLAEDNSIFDDITSTSVEFGYKTPKKAKKTVKKITPISNNSSNRSNEKENSNQSHKSVSSENVQTKDKNCTYFGFDDSENVDQENISPVKVNVRTRTLRPRPVLQQLNAETGPTRAAMPGTAKPKLASSEVVEQLYDQLKSAEDASQFPEKEIYEAPADNVVATNVDNPLLNENDDSQSIHLFEDIEIVHHLKPHRKSYGKAKKVTFPQPADSDSDSQPPVVAESEESDNDDLADLTFHVPDIKPKKTMKKKKPKKQLTKKEEKEVEEWATGFNSMCEDIEEFQLVVE